MRKLLQRFNNSPLRLRLTAWYVLLLGLTLMLFSSYLYFQLKHSQLTQLDMALQIVASYVMNHLKEPSFRRVEASALAYHLIESGFVVRLVGLDGTVQDGFGSYQSVPSWLPQVSGYANLQGDKTLWRLYSQQIQLASSHTEWWLQVAHSLASVNEALENFLKQIFLSLPVVLLLAGLGGLFLSNRALRPIDYITRTVQTISVSDLSQRISYRGPADEVGRLAITFDRMLERLQAAFVRERRFVADAAHELRTPLTIVKGRLGVTLNQERSREEYKNALQALEPEVDRLIRLTNDLLFLARVDQNRLRWQTQALDLSNFLAVIVEQMQPLAQAQQITLKENISPSLVVHGDPDHLISLFLNLLDNAIKYTPALGQVVVHAKCKGTDLQVKIRDTGPGISPEHLPHVFERFYRVEADRSRSTGGTGLGLAIADEIARLHGGRLEVQSEPHRGTMFIVHLMALVK